AFADSITPVNQDMIRREGESVTLSCSYDTSSSYVYLYWYRQYLNREPEYLLYDGARSNSAYRGTPEDRRFQSTASQSSTDLTITECKPDTVDQPDKHVTEAERASVTLQCKYTATTTATPNLLWYIQRENGIPQYMLRINKYGADQVTEFQERFHSELLSDSVPLTIKNLRVFSDRIGPNEEDKSIARKEGESVTLRCSYDTSSNNVYLYWYRQYPNTEPQYLLWKGARSNGGQDITDQRFQSTTSQTSTELTITGCDSLESVDQNTRVQPAVEGRPVTISCTYETSDPSPYLFWYQQKSNNDKIADYYSFLHNKYFCVLGTGQC
ncbi:hypothetical protein QQF64_015185, partial [Cirrhinus molitorella]